MWNRDAETGRGASRRIDAPREWRSWLTGVTGAVLVFESLTGLAIYLLAFSTLNQLGVLLHTVVGLAMTVPLAWFVARHWWVRRGGNLSHYQLLGYVSLALLGACVITGLVLTWQGVAGPRIGYVWDLIHLVTGIGVLAFVLIHLATVVRRKPGARLAPRPLRLARGRFYLHTALGALALIALWGTWAALHVEPQLMRAFPEDYSWRFGEDRPFGPSLARLDYGDWERDVYRRITEILGGDGQGFYRAVLKEQTAEPAGPLARIRRALPRLGLSARQARAVEQILQGAAEQIQEAGAVDPRALAGSEGCGSAGCHSEIYREWLPSAHRYSSLDDMFQRVQRLMVQETSPEHTRYCAGCHDPISLFSGAKNAGNITLSAVGSNEGSSCLVCHSIVQADVQGNGDYTIRAPRRYVYELDEGPLAKFLSDFLIRSYPEHHVRSYSRPLYKTAEFCGACHKQYIDKEVNTDIGKVQGQNQYDSWKNSRWYNGDRDPETIGCRECHMPLVEGSDPASGDAADYNRSVDDAKHRHHGILASNQYIPLKQGLKGAGRHVARVQRWLRGEIEIPEIADKWTAGPVVRMTLRAPETVAAGQEVRLQVVLTNNKTGHDFPTGPLDMLESWVEVTVTDPSGAVVYHTGQLDEAGRVRQAPVIYKADGFDRQGRPIDRHNLWDLVGARYKRALYPGMTDTVQLSFRCPDALRARAASQGGDAPSGARTRSLAFRAPSPEGAATLTVTARLWYRKANPDFLDRVYGIETGVRSPLTLMGRATTTIRVLPDALVLAQ